MRWVTQRRPKIDRLASPWLIRRFVDPQAEFLFVPAGEVRDTAASAGAIPFDVPVGTPGADLVHPPGGTSFDAIRSKFRLDDPALDWVATIVRDADNDNALTRLPEAAGLRAISLGLAKTVRDDHQRLAYGMVLYDALYDWAARRSREQEVMARGPRLHGALCVLGSWIANWRERRALGELNDHLLRDVGLTRVMAQREAAKPFWHM